MPSCIIIFFVPVVKLRAFFAFIVRANFLYVDCIESRYRLRIIYLVLVIHAGKSCDPLLQFDSTCKIFIFSPSRIQSFDLIV
jgi:hypothetical protein